MPAQSRTVLKSYFQRGLRPTQSNYADLIDSFALVSTSGDYVQRTGSTMTGSLVLFANPTAASPDLQAATKRYVDALVASAAAVVGGSNGQIQYNNNGILGGFTVSGDAASLATTGVLTLAPTAVSAGTYDIPRITVDAKGRLTSSTPARIFSPQLVSVSAAITNSRAFVVADSASGSYFVRLPPASLTPGDEIVVLKAGATNTITIEGTGSDAINGVVSATVAITANLAVRRFIAVSTAQGFGNSGWWVVGQI